MTHDPRRAPFGRAFAAHASGPSRARGAALLAALILALVWIASRDVTDSNPLFHPHGYCYLWEPSLVWTHVVADLLIGLAYMTIPIALLVMVRRAEGALPFSGMLVAFGTFIVACGFTHFLEVVTLWQPLFWTAASLKVVTALASVATAAAVPPLVPKVIALIEASKLAEERRLALERARAELEHRVADRTRELTDTIARLRESTAARAEVERRLLARERELREAAEHTSRQKDEVLAMLSHELRTPLNAVLGYVHMLAGGAVSAGDVPRVLATIERNAMAQARLVEDLLDVSGIVTGRLAVAHAPVDLGHALRAAIDAIQPAAAQQQVSIALAVDGPLVTIGDEGRLQQVFGNLLSNAVKFTPAGGRVRVDATADGDRVRVSVADTGRGIDAAFLPHLFEPFRQAESGPTRSTGGLGLGLAIVRHLVDAHGGEVHAQSDGPGLGTTFTVWLPRAR